MGADEIGYIEIINELTVNALEPKQKLIQAFKILKYGGDLLFIIFYPFKVLLVVVYLGH
jgi:hypothetical protein